MMRIGSVINGTTRTEDLIPAFLDVASGLKLSREQRRNLHNHHIEWNKLESAPDRNTGWHDAASELLEILFAQLNDFCPDYTYFGSREGDYPDYGCWPDPDLPFHGPGNDEVGKGELPSNAGDVGQDHWIQVNDHGNCTLYRKVKSGRGWRWVECWSIV